MSGPVYRFDPALDSPDKLPPAYDGSLFVYDWGRNWIKSVRLTADGAVDRIEPFMPHTSFRKPVDLKTGPDGALYVIEFGDKWNGNTDGTIVRLAYVRGNRAPTAVASAEPRAGRHPLPVRFSGVGSIDPDTQDVLTYRWSIEGRTAEGVEADHTFEKPGIYTAWLEVSDPRGARSRSAVEVRVGNAPPRVTILEPVHGGFVDGGRKLRFRAVAEDDEDGSTADGRILAGLVEVHAGFRVRNDRAVHPGLALIRSTTCWSCHKPQEKAVGPSYREVAAKYAGQAAARNLLATKVLEGGKGAWGEVPMIPHPQHTMEQSRSMVDWILTLAENPSEQRLLGTEFELDTPEKPPAGGVFEVSASYTDRGTEVAGKSTAQAKAVLHFRRKPAEFADGSHKAPVVEVFEGGRRLAAQFAPEGHLLFREINLRGIARIRLEAAAPAGRGGRLELRADSPEGRLLGTVEVPSTGAWHAWKPLSMNVDDPGGVRDLYLVASSRDLRSEPLLNLAWIEFLER
jgi:cytochrome c